MLCYKHVNAFLPSDRLSSRSAFAQFVKGNALYTSAGNAELAAEYRVKRSRRLLPSF